MSGRTEATVASTVGNARASAHTALDGARAHGDAAAD